MPMAPTDGRLFVANLASSPFGRIRFEGPAPVSARTGRFGPGRATATVIATVCEQKCVTAGATRAVKLNAGT
jgi:hypothetical protein